MRQLTLGSLFDGIGTALLAADICGIKPMWSSEIEPFPMAVSKHHFPDVKQLGDVTKINGAEIEPVDIIFFGSPCQDLSQAGLRKGLKHQENGDDETTRSGLFMEAVRIAKEMRKADEIRQLSMHRADNDFRPNPRPYFLCWENVPGALSSGKTKGADFRCVLEELAKIKDETAHVPLPPSGRWGDSGQVVGDGFSISYRVLDSRWWGVPQRRKRIFLVCSLSDSFEQTFRYSRLGSCSAEILYKQGGLRGHIAESIKKREEVASTSGACIEAADSKVYDARGNGDGETVCTIVGGHQLGWRGNDANTHSQQQQSAHARQRELRCGDTEDYP